MHSIHLSDTAVILYLMIALFSPLFMHINFDCIIAWLWRYTKFAFMGVHKHRPQLHIMVDIFKVLSQTKSLKLTVWITRISELW